MKSALRVLLVLTVLGATAAAQSPEGDVLSIYLVDVEGGGATLFVSPTGESMLMDTGHGGANADRDVGRIMAAAEDAGLERIDVLLDEILVELGTDLQVGVDNDVVKRQGRPRRHARNRLGRRQQRRGRAGFGGHDPKANDEKSEPRARQEPRPGEAKKREKAARGRAPRTQRRVS